MMEMSSLTWHLSNSQLFPFLSTTEVYLFPIAIDLEDHCSTKG